MGRTSALVVILLQRAVDGLGDRDLRDQQLVLGLAGRVRAEQQPVERVVGALGPGAIQGKRGHERQLGGLRRRGARAKRPWEGEVRMLGEGERTTRRPGTTGR